MTKSPSATLGLGIVKKPATVEKGSASPSPIITTVASTALQAIELANTAAPSPHTTKNDNLSEDGPSELLAMKNISVKVDIVTYKKLKKHGGDMGGKTNQAIFTEALALYFAAFNVK